MSKPLYPSLNPATYLDLAKELSSKSEMAAIRTAADRAYYAAFLTSRDLLSDKGYLIPEYGLSDHQDVIETLKKKEVLGSFGNEEFRLRDARNKITYDTRDLKWGDKGVCSIDWMLDTAKKIIDRVNALPPKS